MITGIDVLVCLVVLACIGLGFGTGFWSMAIDLVSVFGALLLASAAYVGPVALLRNFSITGDAAELTCFIACFLLFTIVAVALLSILTKKMREQSVFSRILGGVLGVGFGVVVASGLLLFISHSPDGARGVGYGRLSVRIVRVMPGFYKRLERRGITVPKMIVLPVDYRGELQPGWEAVRFLRINFARMEGATCIKCRGKVTFAGFFLRSGGALAPKFICSECSRTSDSCQTFEGFHALYGACPTELAKQGQRFDCGNWPNYEWVTPKGKCPVDGNELSYSQWIPPAAYKPDSVTR